MTCGRKIRAAGAAGKLTFEVTTCHIMIRNRLKTHALIFTQNNHFFIFESPFGSGFSSDSKIIIILESSNMHQFSSCFIINRYLPMRFHIQSVV